MIERGFWLDLIERAWREKTVVWLSGVRRSGKTCLCQTLPKVEYFDCELPRVRQAMEDPQGFLDGLHGKRIVLDEVHRLPNPSELLKIAADHHGDVRVLATGSSTLGASAKFKDTLSGRKCDVWLAIECKWTAAEFDPANLAAFRRQYPEGGNVVVAQDVERGFARTVGGMAVRFMSLKALASEVPGS